MQFLPLYQLHDVGEHKSVVLLNGFVEKQASVMLCLKHKKSFKGSVWILRVPAQLPCNIISIFLFPILPEDLLLLSARPASLLCVEPVSTVGTKCYSLHVWLTGQVKSMRHLLGMDQRSGLHGV